MPARFSLYGVAVESPIPCRHAAGVSGDGRVHVKVTTAPLERVTGGVTRWHPLDGASWARTNVGAHVLRWEGLLAARVDRTGRDIALSPLGPDAEAALSGYLYPQLLSFALVAAGQEPWHATVVDVNGAAVAILGPPGAGKSTLAAALVGTGATLVTDDLLVVEGGMALPGPARLKLEPSAARRFLGANAGLGEPLRSGAVKRAYAVPAAEAPVALGALLLLDGPPGTGPARVRGADAIRVVLASTFNRVVTEPERLRRQLAAATRLAGEVPLWRMGRAEGWAALERTAGELPGLLLSGT